MLIIDKKYIGAIKGVYVISMRCQIEIQPNQGHMTQFALHDSKHKIGNNGVSQQRTITMH